MSLTETQSLPVPMHTKARVPANPGKRQRIGKKLNAALRSIVWEGQDIAAAAHSAGLTGIALRCALAKPHVIKALRDERDVFRAYARAGNIHALLDIRTNSRNDNARVAAAKVIEHQQDDERGGPAQTSPGMVIIIGHVEQPLNSPANILELQAGAPPSSGDTTRQAGDGSDA